MIYMKDIVKIFLSKTIPDMICIGYDLTYIKFLFSDEDLLQMMSFFNDNDDIEKIRSSINYLKEVRNNYEHGLKSDEDIFIIVNDVNTFFNLLNDIIKFCSLRDNNKLEFYYDFIRSIWLRMGPGDINDVNLFLERQLCFLKYDNTLGKTGKLDKYYDDFDIIYRNISNEDWFETNNNITFSFIGSVVQELLDNDDNLGKNCKYYELPSIHYAFNFENNIPICYIYGIQSIYNNKDESIKKKIQFIRKQFRNKYVSPDFVIALSLFIDFLNAREINIIKIPLLQVFSYTYHEHLSNNIKYAYSDYSDEERLEFENRYNNGDNSDVVLDYIHTKKMFEKFVSKEDLISKNKTERLINTFLVMNEVYDNIEFMTNPFIESDYLVAKIKKLSRTKM